MNGAGSLVPVTDGSPSCPPPFAPQQRTCPSPMRTQLCAVPAVIAAAFVSAAADPGPLRTAAGSDRFAPPRMPSPSWPELSVPQHATVESARRAHECPEPPTIVRPLMLATPARLAIRKSSVPPPALSEPQQRIVSLAKTAHDCC